MKILMVEDNEDLALNFKKQVMMNSTISVDISHNGSNAFHLLNKNEYDILILDIILPDIDGLELLSAVRNNKCKNKDIFVIITTGITHATLIDNAKQLGANYFVTKPYNFKTINNAIEVFRKLKKLPETNISKDLELERFAANYLDNLDMPVHLKGYDLIVLAFKFIITSKNSDSLRITKDIYPYLSATTNADVKNVERNMRNALSSSTFYNSTKRNSNYSFLLTMKKDYYLYKLEGSYM